MGWLWGPEMPALRSRAPRRRPAAAAMPRPNLPRSARPTPSLPTLHTPHPTTRLRTSNPPLDAQAEAAGCLADCTRGTGPTPSSSPFPKPPLWACAELPLCGCYCRLRRSARTRPRRPRRQRSWRLRAARRTTDHEDQ
eukprot:scaffold7288_cov103-Isochrysis_galbana.AAC.2